MRTLGRTGTRRLLHTVAALATAGGALLVASLAGVAPAGATPPACSPTTPTGFTAAGGSCTIGGTATLTGGTLTVEAPSNLDWTQTLSGLNIQSSASAPLTAIDATGAGLGWNIAATATAFTTGTYTLPTGSLSFNGSSSSQGANTTPVDSIVGTSSSANDSALSYPIGDIDGAAIPVVVYEAAIGSGMGTNNLATDWWLSLLGNTFAGTYTSTITLQIASGP
jgi:hypothetical protein